MPQIDYTRTDNLAQTELPGDNINAAPQYAGFWVRSCAASIDSTIIFFFVIMLLFVGGSFIKAQNMGEQFSLFIMDFLAEKLKDMQEMPIGTTPDQMQPQLEKALHHLDHSIMLVILPVQIIFSAFYFAIPESGRWQGSIGKHLMKIKIVDLNFQRISFWRAFARNLLKIVPGSFSFLISLAIFLPILFDKRKRGLHDMVCKTLVVYKS